jgi:SAM-dependent methyltransferase
MADIVHANNVLAHVADTNGFVAGIAGILKPDGLVVIECPYVRDLVESCEFDTIYHQHLCYFSATSADRLFRGHGLHLADVERTEIHGGSLRLFFSKSDEPSPAVQALLAEEQALGMDRPAYFIDFAASVVELKRKFVDLVRGLKQQGRSLAAYGAAAKACTLLSYTGIGATEIDYIVDRNPFKQGRFFPGCQLPIHDPERLLETQPDFVVILPWNFAGEIMKQQAEYRRRGGRFIIPVPEPRIA